VQQCIPATRRNRERLCRAENPPPRRRLHPALPLTRACPPGTIRIPRRLPGPLQPQDRSRAHSQHRSRPDLLHRHRPHRPPPRQQPDRHNPAQHHPGASPGDLRSAQRPNAPAARPAMRARQETPEEHLPEQETRPAQTARPHHLQDQNTPEEAAACANALTHRPCRPKALLRQDPLHGAALLVHGGAKLRGRPPAPS
jgi:hypothetical protein